MKQCRIYVASLFSGLWMALLLIPRGGLAMDETFAVVETKTGVYSNVTVTTKSKDYIVIQHATGLTSLKVTDLSPEAQQALGYTKTKGAGQGGFTITAKAKSLVETIPTRKIEATWNKHAPAGMADLKLTTTFLYAVLGGMVVLYLWFCYCGALICQKAGRPAGVLMWVPGLQFIPLCRAAKMSPFWMLVPIVNIWGHVLWSFRISAARGQGFWTALFLILPTYPLAFMYLAFANGAPPADENAAPEKFKSTGLVLDPG
jgi:hypothetical protein